MAQTKSWLCAIIVLIAVAVQSQAQTNSANKHTNKEKTSNYAGEILAEEVVVESSLHVSNPNANPKANPQPNRRRTRNAIYYLVPDTSFASLRREKRQIPQYQYPQFQNPFFNNGNSQSTAQSQSHSHGVDQFGTQDANALANAQVFNAGNFGASSNNAATNNLNIGPNGASGGFSNAGAQSYILPNGQTLNIAFNNGASFLPNGRPSTSQGSSISFAG